MSTTTMRLRGGTGPDHLPRPDSDGRTLNRHTAEQLQRAAEALVAALHGERDDAYYPAAFACSRAASVVHRDYEGHTPAMHVHCALMALHQLCWEASKGHAVARESAVRWYRTLLRSVAEWAQERNENG